MVHEAPTSLPFQNTLKEGMVFTVEPGIYIPAGAAYGSRTWCR